MSLSECTTESEAVSSILFAHAADEDLKNIVLPCLRGFSEFYTAENGCETINLYHAKHPLMVVAALDMGDMTGFELCDRIRSVAPETQVVLVGRENGEWVYKCAMEAGAIRYVLMDENATESLKAIFDETLSRYEMKSVQLQKAATYRCQADAFQVLPFPIAILTATGALLSINQEFKNIFGFLGDDFPLELSSALDLIPAAETANGWNGLLEAAEQGRTWSGKVRYRGKNGSRPYVRATLNQYQAKRSGSLVYQLLVLDDITEYEAQRAQLSVQRDSAFEILESIQGVQASLRAMLQNKQIDMTQSLSECVSELENMKGLARLLTSESLPAADTFTLRTLIDSAISSVAVHYKNLAKKIRCTVPPYLPEQYLGMQNAVYRTLACLLGNAMENCEGNEIDLKVDLKEKSQSGMHIRFAVEFRYSNAPDNCFVSMQDYLTTSHNVKNTSGPRKKSLSLAIALVEKMGGTVWVKSMVNNGYTYYFSLCLQESSAANAVIAEGDQKPEQNAGDRFGLNDPIEIKSTAQLRILLADDSEVDQQVIRHFLESMNYKVICVSNGRAAVDEFNDSSFDAVLMDILMPEMDGFEATRMIREKERLVGGGHTPIIALTSYSLKAIHEKCVSVGMDNYLHKPVSALDLSELFKSVQHADLAGESVTDMHQFEDLPTIDIQGTLENLGNKVDLYREIVDLFIAKIPVIHQHLVTAIRSGSLKAVLQHAHMIKGMSANIGGRRCEELALKIQEAALNDDLVTSTELLNSFSIELPRLLEALAAIDWQKLP